MNAEPMTEDVPGPMRRINYHDLADRYNDLAVGQAMSIELPSNITNLKAALQRRGVVVGSLYDPKADCCVWKPRGLNACLIKRKTDKPMSY